MTDDLMLTQMKCVPCEIGGKPMIQPQIGEYMAKIGDSWSLVDDPSTGSGQVKKLTKQFKFKNFKEAMQFVNKVADLAEQEGHHPDMAISWNKVTFTLFTHKIGGLHQNDFVLAAKIDALLN